jgi:hypothetical protein
VEVGQPLIDVVGGHGTESPVRVMVVTVTTWVPSVASAELLLGGQPLIDVVGGHGIESSVNVPVVTVTN